MIDGTTLGICWRNWWRTTSLSIPMSYGCSSYKTTLTSCADALSEMCIIKLPTKRDNNESNSSAFLLSMNEPSWRRSSHCMAGSCMVIWLSALIVSGNRIGVLVSCDERLFICCRYRDGMKGHVDFGKADTHRFRTVRWYFVYHAN